MKIQVVTMHICTDDGEDYTLSRIDKDGDELEDGYYALRDDKGNEVVVTTDLLKAAVRAAEAAATGVLLD